VATQVQEIRAYAKPEATQGALATTFTGRAEGFNTQNRVAVFSAAVRAVSPDGVDDASATVLLFVKRLLLYDNLPEDTTVDELNAFAGTNAVFNAWPYLRSDIQDLSIRVGLSPLVLPVLRVGRSPAGTQAQKRQRSKTKGKHR
jgi:hypothetical protein